MAEKRMFTMKIVDSDAFLDMPLSTQCLYFHLNMRADDDGFIGNPRRIMRTIGAGEDDLKLLIAKRFVLVFESGVIVIKHWRMHNCIRADRHNLTTYTDELALLQEKPNKSYTLEEKPGTRPALPSGSEQDKPDSSEKIVPKDSSVEQERVMQAWNQLSSLGIQPISRITSGSKRSTSLRARLREYGADKIIEAIERIKTSDFLVGKNSKGWMITFDWFVLPSNFPKVLEGNYNRNGGGNHGAYSDRITEGRSTGEEGDLF